MTICSECKYLTDKTRPEYASRGKIWFCNWYRRRIQQRFIVGTEDCPKFDFKIKNDTIPSVRAPNEFVPTLKVQNDKIVMLMSPRIVGPTPIVGPKPEPVITPSYTKEDLMPIDMSIVDKTVEKELSESFPATAPTISQPEEIIVEKHNYHINETKVVVSEETKEKIFGKKDFLPTESTILHKTVPKKQKRRGRPKGSKKKLTLQK